MAPRRGSPQVPDLRANPYRLEKRIEELAEIGRDDTGGITRLAFGAADVAARARVAEWMRAADLEVRTDAAGNLIGRREGLELLPPIASGSHIDTVPSGGKYDGSLGVLGAIECAQVIRESGYALRHPLEVIVFADEEDGMVGSRAMTGRLPAEELARVGRAGRTLADGIAALGGDPTRLEDAARDAGELRAYVELHVEQGAILDDGGIEIGVVEGIVGIRWSEVTVDGIANHAGTTPMGRRRDALVAASRLVVAVDEIVRSIPGDQVGTVGRIAAEPGAANVIPGRVTLSLELRDLSADKLAELDRRVREAAARIATESGTTIRFAKGAVAAEPALMDDAIRALVSDAARELGLRARSMPSGAGHDAQHLTAIAPTGMIFVPSARGISHSPDEFTPRDSLAHGVDVLLHTLLSVPG